MFKPRSRVQILVQQFTSSFGLPFEKILPQAVIVIDVYRTHDVKLARGLYGFLNPGDVFLSDRACCSYADIYFINNQNCDAVIRLHKSRKQQMKKGKRIGPCDQLLT